MSTPLQPPPLAVYVHFPWCVRKCPYCDFNSHEAGGELPEAEYLTALRRDLEDELANVQQQEICSVFLGGGTPSLFSPRAIADVLAMIGRHFEFAPDVEITLEANPGTTEQTKFKGYIEAGVNRLSIGVQSFNDTQLQQLGRIHSAEEARAAFESARNAGFGNINLDLMHGLPGQSVEDALGDLEIAVTSQPEHISWYQLTIEPNTRFYKFPPQLPDEDTLWAIYERGGELLEESGYRQYEVSAYSREGRQSRHNLNYWQFGDYIGIGAGAHGKLTTTDGIIRTTRTRTPRDYLVRPGRTSSAVEEGERMLEFLMNALRLNRGFHTRLFEQRTGLPADRLGGFLQRARDAGFLSTNDDQNAIHATPKGRQFLNDLLLLVKN